MPADNDAKAAAAEPRSAGQTEAERNGLAKKGKAPGRSFAEDKKKKAMEERMQRGRDLLNGPRGQNTAHRMQQCAALLLLLLLLRLLLRLLRLLRSRGGVS